MVEDLLRYDRMVEVALRGVVRQAISEVAHSGLLGEHHFYLTFSTAADGVDIPVRLAERYPDEMTIILQHQFYGLEVVDEAMRVTLSFDGIDERLTIPLAAISTFADPSVNFALQFQPLAEAADRQPAPADGPPEPEAPRAVAGEPGPKVVTLDRFRKK